MGKVYCIKALSTAVIAAILAGPACAQRVGDLMVSPTRLSLDDNARSGSVTVVNRGKQTIRYRINFVDMDMSEDGVLIRVKQGGANSAAGVLKLSPREFVLEPGGSQRVKILAVVPPATRDGEFRSHLSFEAIGTAHAASPRPDTNGELRIGFETKAVVTIPVIIGHGALTASATVSDVSVTHNLTNWVAKLRVNRFGNRTVRGDVVVSFVPSNGGRRVVLGQVNNLPVYFPNAGRVVTLALKQDLPSLGKGEIEVRFVETERGRGGAVAKTTVPAPG